MVQTKERLDNDIGYDGCGNDGEGGSARSRSQWRRLRSFVDAAASVNRG